MKRFMIPRIAHCDEGCSDLSWARRKTARQAVFEMPSQFSRRIIMAKCPVCGMMVDENTAPSSEYKGKTYYFMNPTHKTMFDNEPEKFLNKQDEETDHKSMDM
jgi:YHS domain-containing protein